MSGVVHMLGSDNVTLPSPICPSFSVGRSTNIEEGSSSNASTSVTVNEITLSEVLPRWSTEMEMFFFLALHKLLVDKFIWVLEIYLSAFDMVYVILHTTFWII
jgi:hypothetical protein